jgi:hypothetical protein
MITPDEFKKTWCEAGDELARFSSEDFSFGHLPIETVQFLQAIGLPRDATPFLSFGPRTRPVFPENLRAEGHVPIGSNGSGDPVVIAPDGRVQFLNHDCDFAPCYINKDVQTLAEALLRYRRLVKQALRMVGPDAYLNGQIPRSLQREFVSFLQENDPQALQADAMWGAELAASCGSSPET